MFSFRSLFAPKGRAALAPLARRQKSRPSFRPRLECLEDRTLLNARFVVAVGAPVDNITNFATLSSALTTADSPAATPSPSTPDPPLER